MSTLTDPRVASVEDNLTAFLDALTTRPWFAVERHPDVLAFRSGLPHPFFNGVAGARFAAGAEAERAAAIVAPFADRGLPFLWWCGPATWSAALDRALTGLGLQREDAPGMHASLAHGVPQAPPVPGLEIELGPDTAGEEVARVMGEGFEIPADLVGALRDLITSDPTRVVNAMATLDGEQVGCGTLWVSGRTAGLYNIATLPPARHRGIGYAVTAALMREGLARGCVESVLDASPMGLPVYRRLGFEEVCVMPQYLWLPDA